MSKLSFRARALDAARPMAVYLGDELPDLPDHSAISRAVPAMPTGMEKDEECEHHLQRAICAGLIIPTPEVSDMSDVLAYNRLYPADYNKPRQLIHMQPLGLEQEVPDYDMDSEDERWLRRQHLAAGGRATELTELKFEETMEKLEKGSGQTVVTLKEARALVGRSGLADHILAAVYDYWLNKRLATQQPLLLAVRTEPRPGAPQASPYLAFRRRTEKMQTRKNRKNDESSYEKMVKLRRELSQVVTLLDMIRQREKLKRDLVVHTTSIIDKRYVAQDFGGNILAEAKAAKGSITPLIIPTGFGAHHRPLDSATRQRDKRQYKRRKHRHHSSLAQSHAFQHGVMSGSSSSSEGEGNEAGILPPVDSGPFTFRRKPGCQYHMPTNYDPSEEVPWITDSCKENAHPAGKSAKSRYVLASVNHPKPKCVGFVRRRIGRGGRVILDRLSYSAPDDRLWESLGYTIRDSHKLRAEMAEVPLSPLGLHSSKPSLDSALDRIECGTSRSQESETARPLNADKMMITNDCADVTIKTEATCDAEVNLSEKQCSNETTAADGSSDSDSLSSCDGRDYYNSEFNFNGRTPDWGRAFKGYRDRIIKRREARRKASSMYREDMRVMAELLVARQLDCHARRVPDVSSSCVDNFLKDVWGNRLHFKPKSPDPDEKVSIEPEEEDTEQLTEHSPITVHVRLALPDAQEPPSESLFADSSPFYTSEFTLADIYGDNIIDPNPDIDPAEDHRSLRASPGVSWSQTNGPVPKPDEDAKAEISENSNSNQTSVFLSSEGGPPSAASVNSDTVAYCDDSAAAASHENGVVSEWNNDSTTSDSEKLKQLIKKPGNGIAASGKHNESSVLRVEPKIYLESRPASPSFSLLPTRLQPSAKTENLAIVHVKAPAGSLLPQSKVKQVLKSVLTGGSGDSAEVHAPLLVTQGGSPVRKAADGVKVRGLEEGGGQQQLMTLAVSDSIKLRLQSHLLNSNVATGNASNEILGIVHPKALTPTSIPRDGIAGHAHRTVVQVTGGARPVRVLHARPISPSQRSRLMTPSGALRLRNFTNVLQLQMRAPAKRVEAIETAPQPVEAASAGGTTAGTGGEAGPASSGPAPAAGPPSTTGKPPQPSSPRKGQASLPMEVT